MTAAHGYRDVVDEPAVSSLPDVRGLSLDDLLDVDNPILRAALRRILDDVDRADELVAGFQSAI